MGSKNNLKLRSEKWHNAKQSTKSKIECGSSICDGRGFTCFFERRCC